MRYITSLIITLLVGSLGAAPVVIKSKAGRLREVILELDDDPYTAPELIVGSSGVSIVIFPGIVQGCELSFIGYDYRKGMVNKTTGGIFQEIVLRYDLSKIPAERRENLQNHRFSVSCSFEYEGKSRYVEFDTVFSDKNRYSFAWIRFEKDLKKAAVKLRDYEGFEFVRIKNGTVEVDDGSVEKAFGVPTRKTLRAELKKDPMEKFQSVTFADGRVKLKD